MVGRRTRNWSAPSASWVIHVRRAATRRGRARARPRPPPPHAPGAGARPPPRPGRAPSRRNTRAPPLRRPRGSAEGHRVQGIVQAIEPARALARPARRDSARSTRARRPRPAPAPRRRSRPGEGLDAHARRHRIDSHRPASARGRVIVPVVHLHRDGQRHGDRRAREPIRHVGGIGPRLHPHALLEHGIGEEHSARPAWCRRGGSARSRDAPWAGDGAVRPAIGVEVPAHAAVFGRLLRPRDEAPSGPAAAAGRHQQPVVTAACSGRPRSRGEAADAVHAELLRASAAPSRPLTSRPKSTRGHQPSGAPHPRRFRSPRGRSAPCQPPRANSG